MEQTDNEFIKLAIEEAKKCKPEDGRPHPLVGVVVVKNGKKLTSSFRGQANPGDHAEFIALESMLADESICGATVYTTLEPCTTRNHPKVPCAQRLIERKVSRVVVGMLDPNEKITGKGVIALRKANIDVVFFPKEMMEQVEELNRDFMRAHSSLQVIKDKIIDDGFIQKNRGRRLDEWYNTINYIYWNRNFNRDYMAIFSHLVEVTGGLSLLASNKNKPGLNPEDFVQKCIAWWMALCGKVGIKSVEDMLWAKFPYLCTYCQAIPHDSSGCTEKKRTQHGPPWDLLEQLGENKSRPKSLSEWQRMFSDIYPAQQTEDYGPTFARLTEELGELSEALRIFPAAPGYFLSEAADVFAWLMHVQSIIDQKKGTLKVNRGVSLERSFCYAYPDRCIDCNQSICNCPPILEGTVGRIAHEVPTKKGSFEKGGSFITHDRARIQFKIPV